MKLSGAWRLAIACLFLMTVFGGRGVAQQACNASISLSPQGTFPTFPAAGGYSFFYLSTGGNGVVSCNWSLTSNSFIHASPTSGGGGSQYQWTVNFSVDPNPNLAPRTGYITATQQPDNSSAAETINQAAASGDFTIAVSPSSQAVVPGGSTSYNITISRSGQFTGCVGLGASLPSGVTATFNPSSVCGGNTSVMTISASAGACTGSFPIIVSGANGNVTHTVSLTLNIVGDFSLSVNPAVTIVQGVSSPATVSINRLQGLSGAVSLTTSGLPSGASASFSPNDTTGNSSTMTTTVDKSSPIGTFPVTITGTSGCLTRSTSFDLTISPAWWPAIQELLQH